VPSECKNALNRNFPSPVGKVDILSFISVAIFASEYPEVVVVQFEPSHQYHVVPASFEI